MLVFGALLVRVNIVFDYAKVRAVVEDRRSMIGALVAAAPVRPAERRRGRGAVSAERRALRGAPCSSMRSSRRAPDPPALAMWLGFAVGQIYLAARLWLKLVFLLLKRRSFRAAWRMPATSPARPVPRPEPPIVERAVPTPESR